MMRHADGLASNLQEYAALVGTLDYCESGGDCCRADFAGGCFIYPLV